MLYECITCELAYCVNCETGEDACPKCQSGPRCTACAAEHAEEHAEEHEADDFCANCGAPYHDGDENDNLCSKCRV